MRLFLFSVTALPFIVAGVLGFASGDFIAGVMMIRQPTKPPMALCTISTP